MLIQLLIDKPRMIGPILAGTPFWVWLILGALLLWGASMRKRTMGAVRAAAIPVVMTGLSLAGMISSFGHTAAFGQVLLAWAIAAVVVKYMVGIESRIDPSLAHTASYSLTYGVLYGVFSGIFACRSLRLARLALRSSAQSSSSTVIA